MAQISIASRCLGIMQLSEDVIPPAQADFKEHHLKDEEATLSFLRTCCGGTLRCTPNHPIHAFEQLNYGDYF